MKALIVICVIFFACTAYGQSMKQPAWKSGHSTLLLKKAHHSYPATQAVGPAKKILITSSTLPEKLPMFCALEKKLKDTCNVWIKIRLPEHP